MSSENLRLSLGTCTDGSKGTSAVFGFATGAFFRGGVDMEAATGNIGAFLAGGENRLLFSAGRGGGREGGDAKELFKKGLLMVSCRRVRFWFNAQRAKTSVREIKPPHNARCDHVCTQAPRTLRAAALARTSPIHSQAGQQGSRGAEMSGSVAPCLSEQTLLINAVASAHNWLPERQVHCQGCFSPSYAAAIFLSLTGTYTA